MAHLFSCGNKGKGVVFILTVTYSVNGNPISFEELSSIQITRKDYIDYVEDIKRKVNADVEQNRKG